jgi:ribosomal protein L37AE/L43A
MSRPSKPKVCDGCGEEDKLHWNKDCGWICDLCQVDVEEQAAIRDYEEQEAFEAMLDEDYGEDYGEDR